MRKIFFLVFLFFGLGISNSLAFTIYWYDSNTVEERDSLTTNCGLYWNCINVHAWGKGYVNEVGIKFDNFGPNNDFVLIYTRVNRYGWCNGGGNGYTYTLIKKSTHEAQLLSDSNCIANDGSIGNFVWNGTVGIPSWQQYNFYTYWTFDNADYWKLANNYLVSSNGHKVNYNQLFNINNNGSTLPTWENVAVDFSDWTLETTPPVENCSDGIKNQNETGIDIGGICTGSFNYTGTGSTPGTKCSTKELTTENGVTWYTDFGTLPETAWQGSGNVEGGLGFQDTANNGLDTDFFRGIYFGNGSYVPHGIMTGLNTNYTANVEYLEDRMTPLSPKDPRIRILSKRNGKLRDFNIIKTSGTGSFNGILEAGSNYAEFGRYENGTPSFINQNYNACTQDNGSVNNTCIITFNGKANFADLHINSGMTGLKIGLSGTTEKKVSCQNSSYSCNWKQFGTGSICTGINLQNGIFIEGDCSISSEGYCVPTSVTRNPTADEHCSNFNSSGSCIEIAPGPYEGYKGEDIVNNDIFSCPDYKGWTDSVQCLITVFKNVVSTTKKSIGALTSDQDKTIIGQAKKIGNNTATGQNFGEFSNTGVNLADTVFRGAWNKGNDGSSKLNSFGIYAMYGTILMVIIAIILSIPALSNKYK